MSVFSPLPLFFGSHLIYLDREGKQGDIVIDYSKSEENSVEHSSMYAVRAAIKGNPE